LHAMEQLMRLDAWNAKGYRNQSDLVSLRSAELLYEPIWQSPGRQTVQFRSPRQSAAGRALRYAKPLRPPTAGPRRQ
jgi:hypothetical protein